MRMTNVALHEVSDIVQGCMVSTERDETAVVSCVTSHVSVVHHFGGYSKPRYKKLVTHLELLRLSFLFKKVVVCPVTLSITSY